MSSTWGIRQPLYPEASTRCCDSYFEEETDPESYPDESKSEDPCHPGRSFEWPLEEECGYEEGSCLEEEICEPSEYGGSPYQFGYHDGDPGLFETSYGDELNCGGADVSDLTTVCNASDSEAAGFVPDCVSNQRALNDAIHRINAFTTLDEFMAEVGPLTEDRGAVMKELMTAEVASFREYVKDIYKTRIQHKEDQTEEEFLRLQEKYNKKIVDLNSKISNGIRAIERVIPDFNHGEYKRHGYAYIHDKIEEAQVNAKGMKTEEKSFAHDQIGREIRSSEHKAKWFFKEARRLERKNDKANHLLNKMYEQLASISRNVAQSNARLHTYNVQLEKYACCLKSEICKNQELLNHLMNVSEGGFGSTKCFTVKPEDVVEDCNISYDCR